MNAPTPNTNRTNPMKTRILFYSAVMAAAFSFHAKAGTIFYVPVPAEGSDAQSGLDRSKVYTSGIVAGNRKPAGRNVNGVPLAPLAPEGNSATANGITLSTATGTLANGGGKSETIKADGATAEMLSGMIFNDGAGDNSEQYVVLDPATLAAGKTYDLRVYICNASGENRQVNLSFAGDGKPAVNTDFFNEDDATTSSGGFADPNQVYYINYRFTWDGVSTPGFTATQRLGSMPFCLYAVTNEEVGAAVEAQPAGAVTQVEPDPIAAPPPVSRGSRTTSVDYEDDIGVSSEVFYSADTLRDHGRWSNVGTYGRCWQPTGLDPDWQPYTRGHWVYSPNDGWVWDSDEDFGWATYHYGRWFREENSGWYWVPGRTWAPAWVSWRHGHSFVGWAPLPPLALAAAGIGIGSWADHRYGIGPNAYSFVNARDFGARSMSRVIIPRGQNAGVMANTVNVTNIAHSRNGLFNGGPNFNALNNSIVRGGGTAIPRVSVARQNGNRPVTQDGKFSHLQGDVLSFAAPTVTRTGKKSALPAVAGTIAAPKIDKGWNGIVDPKHTTALQAKIASETPGSKTKFAPARLPGTIPTATTGNTTPGTSPLKPFRNNRNPGNTVIPGTPGTAFVKPGQPVSPTGTAPVTPVAPTTGNNRRPGKPGAPITSTTLPVTPGGPVVVAPVKPGRPGTPVTPLTQPGKPVVIATPTPAPGGPSGNNKKGFKKPGTPGSPVAVTPPVVIPTPTQPTAVPTPEPVRPKKGKGQPTNTTPTTPGTAPVIKPAPTPAPEPVRPKRVAPVATPAPEPVRPKRTAPVATPAPAPVKPAPTAEPVRPKRVAPVATPAPAPKPAPAAPRPAPVPVRTPPPAPIVRPAPVAPRPAPVIPPPRPAPVAPKATPTPTPKPVNG